MKDAIDIMHLSDLHIDPDGEGLNFPVFDSLCEQLTEFQREKGKSIDLLIISGDLVNQGSGNYELINKRIDQILSTANLPKDRVFLVPGNHDITWKNCTGFYKRLIRDLKSNPDTIDTLEADEIKAIAPGFSAYQAFASQFPLMVQQPFPLPGFSQADLVLANLPIRLCGLNSAIIAGPQDGVKDNAQLKDRIIGKKLLANMLAGSDRLNLVVSHYPLSWINAVEQREVTERLQRAGAIYFHGHIHEAETHVMGVQHDSQLLVLGVGTLYGEKWEGRNHCQILELDPAHESPRLHEWFWFGNYGWRRFEPVAVSWPKWNSLRSMYLPGTGAPDKDRTQPPSIHTDPVQPASKPGVIDPATGLIAVGNARKDSERTAYYQKALQTAAKGSEFIVVGRSLIDLSLLFESIEAAINERKLVVKLALLDEKSILAGKSWIETPISEDWAVQDIPASMKNFRRIKVVPGTGSLEIYGLPFYSSHSFISYTREDDLHRYCLEEVGMAINKGQRPFIEFRVESPNSYGAVLEKLYQGFMTQERLLIEDHGERFENDTTQRAKNLVQKLKNYGLVDLGVGRKNIDWKDAAGDIESIIDQAQPGGEIFIVGRSLVFWADHLNYKKIGKAMVSKSLNFTFVLADARINNLESLVVEDYAAVDLRRSWNIFSSELTAFVTQQMKQQNKPCEQVGIFELYGIPAYIPETFAVFTKGDGTQYCSIEIGIGVEPNERVLLFFDHISDQDIFTHLNRIFRSIISNRIPAVHIP